MIGGKVRCRVCRSRHTYVEVHHDRRLPLAHGVVGQDLAQRALPRVCRSHRLSTRDSRRRSPLPDAMPFCKQAWPDLLDLAVQRRGQAGTCDQRVQCARRSPRGRAMFTAMADKYGGSVSHVVRMALGLNTGLSDCTGLRRPCRLTIHDCQLSTWGAHHDAGPAQRRLRRRLLPLSLQCIVCVQVLPHWRVVRLVSAGNEGKSALMRHKPDSYRRMHQHARRLTACC